MVLGFILFFFPGLSLLLFLFVVCLLYASTTRLYADHCFKISLALSCSLCALSLLAASNVHPTGQGRDDFSLAGKQGREDFSLALASHWQVRRKHASLHRFPIDPQ